jgi:hypothetical protein
VAPSGCLSSFVTHLNRPSENVTGVSLFSVPLIAKRLELLHEVIPQAPVVAVLVNPSNPNAEANERGIEIAGRAIGLRIEFIKASSDQDFEPAFASIRRRAGAMIVSADGFYASRREHLIALAGRHAIPTMYFQREFVPLGGLISYGTDTPGMYRQAGVYTGRILKGAKPSEPTRSASSVAGTSRPSALAVLRLRANSNLIGCSTGVSARQAKHAGNRRAVTLYPRLVGLTIGKHFRQDSNLIKQSRLSLLASSRPYRLDSWGDGAPVGGWPLFGRGVALGSRDRCLRALNAMR